MSVRFIHPLPLLVLCGLWLAPGSVYAQRRANDTQAKPRDWTLRVNAEVATLKFLGGQAIRGSDGGEEMKYDVHWAGRPGELVRVADARDASGRVKLSLILSDGTRIECHGFMARGGRDMMAGVCGDQNTPGAWYAVRSGPAGMGGADARLARVADLQAQVDALTRELELTEARAADLAEQSSQQQKEILRAQSLLARFENKSDTLQQVRRQQSAAQSYCRSDPTAVSSFKRALTGRYTQAGGGERDDSATPIAFPGPPAANSALSLWLGAHNVALLSVLQELYPQPEIAQFLSAEREACKTGGIYCRVAFRQQAIGYALTSMR